VRRAHASVSEMTDRLPSRHPHPSGSLRQIGRSRREGAASPPRAPDALAPAGTPCCQEAKGAVVTALSPSSEEELLHARSVSGDKNHRPCLQGSHRVCWIAVVGQRAQRCLHGRARDHSGGFLLGHSLFALCIVASTSSTWRPSLRRAEQFSHTASRTTLPSHTASASSNS
jgi:hypothetical protein